MQAFEVTRKGLTRRSNQDRALVKVFENGSILLAIADGMGGHAAGDRASQTVIESLDAFESSPPDGVSRLADLVHMANQKLLEASAEDPALEGMGTTLTVLYITGRMVHWVHVGDTRAYLFRKRELIRITDDHTVPGLMLSDGELTEEEARAHPMKHVLLNCLGRDTFETDTGSFEASRSDLLMLSTDGLHDALAHEEIAEVLRSPTPDLQDTLDALVSAALRAGSTDDITISMVEIP